MQLDVGGAPVHTRSLGVRLEQGVPGRVRARGSVLDLRKRGLVPMASDLQTAGVIHHMRVEGVVAVDGPRIEEIRAEQPSVAFEPSPGTGGECCRDPVRRIEALAGTDLDAGYATRLGGAIGGPRGCTHVLTLAQLVGSAARWALAHEMRQVGSEAERPEGQRIFERSLAIDGIDSGSHGLALALQLVDVHFAVTGVRPQPLERLSEQREVRVQALVDLDTMTLRRVEAAERVSARDSLATAAWRDRGDAVGELAGRAALGGLARVLLEKLGDREGDRPLLDALLNLAPALIQCIPGMLDRWRTSGESARPSMMAGGGMADSCYMWRSEGALHHTVRAEYEAIHASAREKERA